MPWKDLMENLSNSRRSLLQRVLDPAAIALLTLLVLSSNAFAQLALDDVLPLDQLETPTDDLIRLSTGYADALREYKVAKLSIDTVQSLRPNIVVTNLEVQIANLNLEAAERKARILRAIVEKRLAAAENKLRIIKYLAGVGRPGDADEGPKEMDFLRTNDEATVEILRMILAMR